MDKEYTTQEAAREAGISVYTLRYYERYERSGLLGPVGGARNGHRRLTGEDLGRIRFLRLLRATGMPIQQMLSYVRMAAEGDRNRDGRLKLLEDHRQDLERRIEELERNLGAITAKIEHH
jgi:DNA-binding transcriptional MerR regulator